VSKVYCNNCKYMGPFTICDCRHPENNQPSDCWAFHSKREVKVLPQILNRNNDCKLYKRIWWMFWIQQKVSAKPRS